MAYEDLGYGTTVADLQELHRKAKAARSAYTGDWFLNTYYYTAPGGTQWWNVVGERVKPLLPARGRDLVTDNRIMPVVTHRVSKKVKNKPTFICAPVNEDESAINSARIEQRVLEADWEGLELQSKLFQAVLWADVACDGFWKIYWDNTIGEKDDFLFGQENKPLHNPTDGTPLRATEQHMVPPEVAGLVNTKTIALGDVCVEVISPLELFPDPLATSMEDCEWMIEEKIRSKEYIQQRYPTDSNGNAFVPVPDSDAQEDSFDRVAASGLYSDYSGYEGTKVYEYWSNPNPKYPQGCHKTWINDTLVVADENPVDPMPYVKFSSIQVPGRFWSQALTTHLRGPQEQLNKIRTQVLENAKRLGNPALLESRHANVEYHGIPGERVKFDSSFPDSIPQYLIPPPIPSYVENEIERIQNSIEEISGIHEVSKATVPTGVTAASAINLLQEQDDTRIGPEIQAMERALEVAGSKILKLRAKFNTDERTIRTAGEDGDWDILSFKNEALGLDPEVQVQAGSAMPRSKAAKQAAMTEILGLIFQYGIQVDQRALRRYLKSYEAGALESLFANISEDESQVTREHRRLRTGEPVKINPGVDDHRFHIEAHTEEMKTARWDSTPEPVKQLFVQHVDAHRQYLVDQVNAQIQAQQADMMAQQQMQVQAQQQVEQAKQNGKPPETAKKQETKKSASG